MADDLRAWRRIVLICCAALCALPDPIPEQPVDARVAELRLIGQWTLFIAVSAVVRGATVGEAASRRASPRGAEPEGGSPREPQDPERDESDAYRNIVQVFKATSDAGFFYASRLKEVRDELLGAFAYFEDYAVLRETPSANLEVAVSLLLFQQEGGSTALRVPIAVDKKWPKGQEPGSLDHALADFVESFFLPRFDLRTARRATRAAQGAAEPRAATGWRRLPAAAGRWMRFLGAPVLLWTQAAFILVSALLFVVWYSWPWLGVNAWIVTTAIAAVVTYLPHLFATSFTRMALLPRIPASVAIGGVLMLAFPAQWWREAYKQVEWWGFPIAGLVLAVVAYSYLLAEARGHRVGKPEDRRRAAWVGLIVFGNAVLVALIMFGVFFPIFAENESPAGAEATSYLQSLAALPWEQRFWILTLASLFITVVGLFSQVLWDDKAITAPLAHTSWRRKA
ncbi:hypothetical protein [Microbacterium sp.]|uniref:hypothetical protein n=1 Tax=Microbacterium sp. TaxID=51671 RepID=UPI0039E65850